MESSPLVSVIVPCFNVSAYVQKAVLSILNQTYTNLEIILVDDASTDNTLSIIRSFDDKRIRIIEFNENTKKIGAVNKALTLTRGYLIAFQDADDWSEPDRIEQQVNQFNTNNNLGICFTKYRYLNPKEKVPDRIALTDDELKDEFLKFGFRRLTNLAPTMCATMMITRNVLLETKGYHPYFTGRVAEDIHWVFRILKDYKGAAVDKPLYNINLREGSLTHSQFAGQNAKAAYTWQLLSLIITKQVQEDIDLLDTKNFNLLKEIELIACENALISCIKSMNTIRQNFENSYSYKLGNLILAPFRLLKAKNLIRKFKIFI